MIDLGDETRKTSQLQEKLEGAGWRFVTNVDSTESDSALTKKYLQKDVKDVMITDAYDISGNPSPSQKAVYVLYN